MGLLRVLIFFLFGKKRFTFYRGQVRALQGSVVLGYTVTLYMVTSIPDYHPWSSRVVFYFADGPLLFILVCFVVYFNIFSASDVVCRKIGKARELKCGETVVPVNLVLLAVSS